MATLSRTLVGANWTQMPPMFNNRMSHQNKHLGHANLNKAKSKAIWDLDKQMGMRRSAQERY
jgi:hypothetical protein